MPFSERRREACGPAPSRKFNLTSRRTRVPYSRNDQSRWIVSCKSPESGVWNGDRAPAFTGTSSPPEHSGSSSSNCTTNSTSLPGDVPVKIRESLSPVAVSSHQFGKWLVLRPLVETGYVRGVLFCMLQDSCGYLFKSRLRNGCNVQSNFGGSIRSIFTCRYGKMGSGARQVYWLYWDAHVNLCEGFF